MKKILLPLVLILMLAIAVVPASAGKGNGPGTDPGVSPGNPSVLPQPEPKGRGTMTTFRQSMPRDTFAVVGTIYVIDLDAGTITLTVLRANYLAKPFINTALTVVITESTKVLYKATIDSPALPYTIEELQVDDVVSINGQVVDDVFIAKRITKGASLKSAR